jgi:hypothetical protein
MQRNSDAPSRVSRRYVLATAGALGAAAAAVGGVGIVGAVSSSEGAEEAAPQPKAAMNPADGPIVVHLADPDSGTLDIFAGTGRMQVRDTDLAARLIRAAAA